MTQDTPTSRTEHLAWCKQRALELIDRGELQQAFASMASDLGKHPETAGHPAIGLGFQLMMIGELNTTAEMRKFIQDFG